jgi:hypothetical protein
MLGSCRFAACYVPAMRFWFLVSLVLLAGCGPTYAGLHGTVDMTIAAGGGGDGAARAGPVDAKACWWKDEEQRRLVTLQVGPTCVLNATWDPQYRWLGKYPVEAGGAGSVLPGQACVLELGNTKTELYVQTGAFLQTREGGPIDATIGGVTPSPQRYVTFHFAGAPYRSGDDAWCDGIASRSASLP